MTFRKCEHGKGHIPDQVQCSAVLAGQYRSAVQPRLCVLDQVMNKEGERRRLDKCKRPLVRRLNHSDLIEKSVFLLGLNRGIVIILSQLHGIMWCDIAPWCKIGALAKRERK